MIDCDCIKVLLIGTTHFPFDSEITPIPNINVNIKALKESLMNPDILGISEDQIEISLDEDRLTVESKLFAVTEATRNKKFTLIVYYAGHGMINTKDGRYYLLTHSSKLNPLQVGSIFIDEFKRYIKNSLAQKKIIILDCCHSGKIIDKMGAIAGKLQSEIDSFHGTYIMTSSSATDFSLFPNEVPDAPTYFTGKLLDIINNGNLNENEHFSVGEIFNEIYSDFEERGLPKPQQSNFEWGQNIIFAKNKAFRPKKDDEPVWEKVLLSRNIWDYIDFNDNYPNSVHVAEAKQRIFEFEDARAWDDARRIDEIYSYEAYIEEIKGGKHVADAASRLAELKTQYEEFKLWKEALARNDHSKYYAYLVKFPQGRYAHKAGEWIISRLEEYYQDAENNAQDASSLAQLQLEKTFVSPDQILAYEADLEAYPDGKFSKIAQEKINKLKTAKDDIDHWIYLSKNGDINQLEEFAKKHLGSPYYKKANDKILELTNVRESLDWKKASFSTEIVEVQSFIDRYPNSIHVQEAEEKVKNLNEFDTPQILQKRKLFYYVVGLVLLVSIVSIFIIRTKQIDGKKFFQRALNSKDSVLWLSNMLKAANEKYDPAYLNLGNYYQRYTVKADSAAFWYGKSASTGDAQARYALALMYLGGDGGLPKDSLRAFGLLKLSSDSGHILSQYKLGKLYEAGIKNGPYKNNVEAAKLFQMAAAKNMADAQFELATFHERGLGGVTQDSSIAFELYKKSAEGNYARGQLNLAIRYEKGSAKMEKNLKLAEMWYRKAAIQGEPQAQYWLGLLYESVNIDSAIHWYTKATDKDYGPALVKMGYIKAYGVGGSPKDPVLARYYYQRAVIKKNSTAAFNLGYMYEFGRGGLEVNKDSAVYWYRQASKNASAQYYLGVMYENGEGGLNKDQGQALQLYINAAKSSNCSSEALYKLGTLYEGGNLGVQKNYNTALYYYKLSAQHKCVKAYQRLIDIYKYGQLGVTKDRYTARSYYNEAKSNQFTSIRL